MNVWKEHGLEKVIHKVCLIDKAGETVLGFLLEMPQHETMGQNQEKVHGMIAINCWYLLWERRKLRHGEKRFKLLPRFLTLLESLQQTSLLRPPLKLSGK